MGKTVRPERQRESAGGDTGAEHDGGEPGGRPTAGGFEQGDDGMNPIERLGEYVSTDERGVSSVIGVVLMVAVAVILAAVIATFALGVGDDVEDSTPSAQLNVEVEAKTLKYDTSSYTAEFNVVKITHQGGDPIKVSNLNVTVNGKQPYDFSDTTGTAATYMVKPFASEVYEGDKFKTGDSFRFIVYDGTDDSPAPLTVGSSAKLNSAPGATGHSPDTDTCAGVPYTGSDDNTQYISTGAGGNEGIYCEDTLHDGDTFKIIYEPNDGTPTVLIERELSIKPV